MQNLGTLLFKIRTRPQNPFNVKTPYLAAIIRGTIFTVSVDARNAALHVATGAVEVHSILSGETALVRPGETATIDSRAGGRMKLVGANGRKPVKKTSKTGAAGKTGKAASAVRKTGGTGAGSTNAAPGVDAKPAIKPANTHHVILRAIGSSRIDLFKLTKGLVNRAEARRNRARKKSHRKRAGGSASGMDSFANLDDASLTSADGTDTTTALLAETSDVATLSTMTDSLTAELEYEKSEPRLDNSGPGSVNSGPGSVNSGPGSVNSGSGSDDSGSGK
jgi:hypothetical protein